MPLHPKITIFSLLVVFFSMVLPGCTGYAIEEATICHVAGPSSAYSGKSISLEVWANAGGGCDELIDVHAVINETTRTITVGARINRYYPKNALNGRTCLGGYTGCVKREVSVVLPKEGKYSVQASKYNPTDSGDFGYAVETGAITPMATFDILVNASQ